MLRIASLAAVTVLTLFAFAPVRAAAGDPREGVDYVKLASPQPPSQPGIEVIEFFSYACPHCNEFEPVVSKWRAGLPADVHFRRVPIGFGRPQWQAVAKLYYALEVSGDLAKLDHAVFSALHVENVPLFDEKSILSWAGTRVADPKRFADAYRSFDVQTKTARAELLAKTFDITGVPSLVVAGRYRVVGREAKTFEELLKVTDQVIGIARREIAPADAGKKK